MLLLLAAAATAAAATAAAAAAACSGQYQAHTYITIHTQTSHSQVVAFRS